ncbi:MAG: signal peptide peptidase SppA [Beijerinckiaceae bacterium]
MAMDADTMAERRRLTRKLSLWRVLAVAAGCVAVVGLAVGLLGRSAFTGSSAHLARVTISGVITGDRALLRLLDDVGKSKASAVLLVVDSPGGTVPGSEMLHESIRRLAEKKPVVAVVNNLAASGGYIAALGADRIIARQTSLVGSIGVLFQFPNVAQLLDRVGVKVETVRSSPLKANPSGLEPTSPEARAAVNALVLESYDWFKTMVRTRRNLTDTQLAEVADGRVFSGRQAVGLKLIDEVGGEREAVAWLEREKSIPKDTPVRDWRRRSGFEEFGLAGSAGRLLRGLGLEATASVLERMASRSEALTLDGLLAVWQPALEN